MIRIATLAAAAVIALGAPAFAQSFAEVIVGQWSMAESCAGPSFAFMADGTATNPDGEQATYTVTETSITIVDGDGVTDTADVVSYADASFELEIDGDVATLYRCE